MKKENGGKVRRLRGSMKQSVSKLKKKLDRIYSQYIRLKNSKDGYCTCISCGAKKPWKEMDCGHYVKRNISSTRYYEKNTYPQCKSCNIFKDGNYPNFTFRLVGMYGPEILEDLAEMSRKIKKFKPYELEEMIEEYKEKLEWLKTRSIS